MSFLSKLPDEHRQRFEAIAAGWRAEFAPEGYQETRLVDILIQNDWLLVSGPPVDALALPTRMQQSEQRLLEAEAALCKLNVVIRATTSTSGDFLNTCSAQVLSLPLLQDSATRFTPQVPGLYLCHAPTPNAAVRLVPL